MNPASMSPQAQQALHRARVEDLRSLTDKLTKDEIRERYGCCRSTAERLMRESYGRDYWFNLAMQHWPVRA